MRRGALAAASALALSACVGPAVRPVAAPRPSAPATPPAAPRIAPSLAALIADDPALSRYRSLAAAGGLSAMVAGRGPVTILAPTDAAFARLPPGTVEALSQPGNRPSLLHLLRFWVVPGDAWSSAVASRTAYPIRSPTLEGEPVLTAFSPGEVTLADAVGRRGSGDVITASDGLLVKLDGIITPRSIEPETSAR